MKRGLGAKWRMNENPAHPYSGQLHVKSCAKRRADPHGVSRQMIPPKATMEIIPFNRTVQVYLGFDKGYKTTGFIGFGSFATTAAAELLPYSVSLLCNLPVPALRFR